MAEVRLRCCVSTGYLRGIVFGLAVKPSIRVVLRLNDDSLAVNEPNII